MAEARWEWTLPGGEQVSATLDPDSGTESVSVGGRVTSQCSRGAKPEGHAVSSTAATVTFDPRVVVCILRIDGEEIAPLRWPVPERRQKRAPATRSLPWRYLIIAALLLVAAVVFVLVRGRRTHAAAAGEMSGVHRDGSGLFVAHFPPAFAARPAIVPASASGLVLIDEARADAIVIVALTAPEALSDVWLAQKRFHGEGLANIPRADGHYEELARRDDTCLGLPGAVVVGRVTNRRGEPARVWSCAVSRGDAGYLVMSSLREGATADESERLRRIVEATELTRLGEMGSR